METIDFVIKLSTFLGAVLAICGIVYGIIRWFQKQNQQPDAIAKLKKLHEDDMKTARENEVKEMQAIKDELCVLSYAMLASLDGLQQLHCNGNVTKAHDMLEKHLNKQAHNQA